MNEIIELIKTTRNIKSPYSSNINLERYELDGMCIGDLSRGNHKYHTNAAAGISALSSGIRKERVREMFSGFQGINHRLEYVTTFRGVKFINDSKATNVNSTWFALEMMERPTILILGGKDMGNDYSIIFDLVKDKVKAIVCMCLDNRPIHAAFDWMVKRIVDTSSARDAVQASYHLAQSGDVVLLSPACASFDLFANYEDRASQFREAIKNL